MDRKDDAGDFTPTAISSNISENARSSVTNAATTSSNAYIGSIPAGHAQMTAAAPEASREEILKQIFGDVGELIDDFSCAVESTVLLHGRMYVTNRFLCFYSNLFGLEKKIRIPYSHITLITKENTALVIPNAMAVTTHRKEYLFRSFWDRDECYKRVQDLIYRHKNGTLSSYPTINSSSNGDSSSDNRVRTTVANRNAAQTSQYSSRSSTGGRESITSLNQAISLDDGLETETDLGLAERSDLTLSMTDYSSAFQEEVLKSKLKLVVVSGSIPHVSIKDFMTLFIEDNAPYSWKNYHESMRDMHVEVSPWKEMSSNLGYGREIKFIKPIPSIRSQTRGVKLQRYRRFGDLGLVVCSSTRLEDVPAADSFSVEDMLSVKQVDDRLVVEITFEIKFIKTTMFRYMIESGTNNEMIQWLENFFGRMKSVFASGGGSTAAAQRGAGSSSSFSSVVASTSATVTASPIISTVAINNVSALKEQPSSTVADAAVLNTNSNSIGNSIGNLTGNRRGPGAMNYLLGLVSKLLDALEGCMDRMGFVGGRIFWCSWLLCLIVFAYFGYESYKNKQQYYLMEKRAADIQTGLLSVVQHQKFLNSHLLRLLSSSTDLLNHSATFDGTTGESLTSSQSIIEDIILQIDVLKVQLLALTSEDNRFDCPN